MYCVRLHAFLPVDTESLASSHPAPFAPPGSQEGMGLKSPGTARGSQRYVIDGLTEKSSLVSDPWERLLDILAVVGARCEWQGDKGSR